jgi:hypothetical protein
MVSNRWAYLFYYTLYFSSMRLLFPVKIPVTESQKFDCFQKSWSSVLYQESEKWRNLLFDCFIVFVRKGVGLPVSVVLFSETKSVLENDCCDKSFTTQSKPHLPWCTITSHNTAHAYSKGYAIKIARNVIQRATSKTSTQVSSVLAVEVWLTSSLGRSRSPFAP